MEAYNTRRLENYCLDCNALLDAESAFLDTGPERLRHQRANNLMKNILPEVGLNPQSLAGIQGNQWGYYMREVDGSAASAIALAVSEELGYPIDHVSGMDPNLAVTDRDCEIPDSNPTIDYPGL